MIFKDRMEAAKLLLLKLEKYRNQNMIIAGIPRGAMPMAKLISDDLKGTLTTVLVHKIPHPTNEEFAIGCIGLSGHLSLSSYAQEFGVSDTYIQAAKIHQMQILKNRKDLYHLQDIEMKGKNVIIIDDGIATGFTLKCAINEIKLKGAHKIIVAVPVASSDVARDIQNLVDEFICLYITQHLSSVGQFFKSFPQVSDSEVRGLLDNPTTINRH